MEKNAHITFCFPNPLSASQNYSHLDIQRFNYHFLCVSTVIFDPISNSSNISLSSSPFLTQSATAALFPSVPVHFLPNQQQQQCFLQFQSIFDPINNSSNVSITDGPLVTQEGAAAWSPRGPVHH
jgi:hypothetical protein